jgi:hypothetical protein
MYINEIKIISVRHNLHDLLAFQLIGKDIQTLMSGMNCRIEIAFPCCPMRYFFSSRRYLLQSQKFAKSEQQCPISAMMWIW